MLHVDGCCDGMALEAILRGLQLQTTENYQGTSEDSTVSADGREDKELVSRQHSFISTCAPLFEGSRIQAYAFSSWSPRYAGRLLVQPWASAWQLFMWQACDTPSWDRVITRGLAAGPCFLVGPG